MASSRIARFSAHAPSHFLCLPLCNVSSMSQLQRFFDKLKAESISQKTFRLPKSFHMLICTYRIEDKNCINAACEILQNLDLRQLLQKSVSRVGFDGSIQLPPLRVSLTDIIQCKRVTETETVVSCRIAHGVVVDSSGLLGSLPVLFATNSPFRGL